MIYLALKRTAAKDAGIFARIAAWLIKARLVSQYCHGGIIDGALLLHSTPADGLHATGDFDQDYWEIYPIDTLSEDIQARFELFEYAPYDWVSLLAFVGIKSSDSNRMYCYEWCWYALTGDKPDKRITPEMLLALIARKE